MPRPATGIAEIEAMANPAPNDRAIGEFGPIAPTPNSHIPRSDVQNAIRIAAKRLVLLAPVHEVLHAPANGEP
jgi:hypothetical protein